MHLHRVHFVFGLRPPFSVYAVEMGTISTGVIGAEPLKSPSWSEYSSAGSACYLKNYARQGVVFLYLPR